MSAFINLLVVGVQNEQHIQCLNCCKNGFIRRSRNGTHDIYLRTIDDIETKYTAINSNTRLKYTAIAKNTAMTKEKLHTIDG